jgi:nucleoside-diphosphate-sugar epimerase
LTVLVTGASGFVGRHLVEALLLRGIPIRVAQRQCTNNSFPYRKFGFVSLSGPGYSDVDWDGTVSGCNVVVHLAARAHVLRDVSESPQQVFVRANVDFALACARAAAKSGVRRFIFMSSAGVHGGTSGMCPINADDAFLPHTLYAQSKAVAERKLADAVSGTGMELTVLRPPLVYGAGAPGNFGALLRAVSGGWPLPLGSVTGNQRSFVSIDNLVDLIVNCLVNPAAANKRFLVSDGEDCSTADFLRRISVAMDLPARLLPFPVSWLSTGARLLGKHDMFQSLCGSFQLDISQTRQVLGWSPAYTLDEGLRRCFLSEQ